MYWCCVFFTYTVHTSRTLLNIPSSRTRFLQSLDPIGCDVIDGRMPIQALVLHNVARRQCWIGRTQFIKGHGRMQQRRSIKGVHMVAQAGLGDDGIRPNVSDGEKVITEEVGFDRRNGREDGEGDEARRRRRPMG